MNYPNYISAHHRPRRDDLLEGEGDGGRLGTADEDRQHATGRPPARGGGRSGCSTGARPGRRPISISTMRSNPTAPRPPGEGASARSDQERCSTRRSPRSAARRPCPRPASSATGRLRLPPRLLGAPLLHDRAAPAAPAAPPRARPRS